MKKLMSILALTLMVSSAFAQHRPGPGRGPGRGPMPGPHRPGPMPGPHRPGPMPGPWRPGPMPIPRPMPYPGGYQCRVTLVDRYNNPIRQFFGYSQFNNYCSAFNDCNFEQRRMGAWGTRCVQY